MNIYLIRHGEAKKTSQQKPHEERELTSNGIQTVKNSAQMWKNHISKFEIIFSSPLKGAMQTSHIIKEVFNLKNEIKEEVSLLNGGLSEDLLNLVSKLETEDVAMIGHQPDIGLHICKFTSSGNVNIKISPATIVKIAFDGRPNMGEGILEFLIPPINKKG